LRNYGNGPNQGVNAESFLNAEKMRQLEKGLDGCFLKCYQGWLMIIILSSSMGFIRAFVSLVTGGGPGERFESWIVISFVYGLWGLVQSIFGLLAIYQKSLAKANVACAMITIYLFLSLMIEFMIINWIKSYIPPPNDDTSAVVYALMYLALFAWSLHVLIHVCVDMVGAFRVRSILSERNVLQEKLDRSNDAIYP